MHIRGNLLFLMDCFCSAFSILLGSTLRYFCPCWPTENGWLLWYLSFCLHCVDAYYDFLIYKERWFFWLACLWISFFMLAYRDINQFRHYLRPLLAGKYIFLSHPVLMLSKIYMMPQYFNSSYIFQFFIKIFEKYE